MTISEFRAWLEGFSASFTDAPNADQWAAIQGKLKTVAPFPAQSTAIPQWNPRSPSMIGQELQPLPITWGKSIAKIWQPIAE